MATYHDIYQCFSERLQPLYEDVEIRSLFNLYVEKKCKIARYKLYLIYNEPIDDKKLQSIDKDLDRLSKGEPIQHILGRADFFGMELKVNSSVLIPRPETEELVNLIITTYKQQQNIQILDIGTGSGAIAIALAKNLPYSHVAAIDISEQALSLASQNALEQETDIVFMQQDILNMRRQDINKYDIIVSNPPYIPLKERDSLHINVKEHDPEIALFVPDDDPLLFYRAIAQYGNTSLKTAGRLYFETHHLFHQEMRSLLHKENYHDITSLKDINGRERFMIAQK